ncbi:MAG: hypothetical protein ACXW34_07040 [Nitrospira sp.]
MTTKPAVMVGITAGAGLAGPGRASQGDGLVGGTAQPLPTWDLL